MSKIENLVTFIFQLLFSASSLYAVYFLFLIADSHGGFDGIVGVLLNLAILGSLAVGITLVICLLVGLPIRFSKELSRVFSDKPLYSVIGIITAMIFLVISIVNYWNAPSVRDDPNSEYHKHVSNTFIILTIAGWFGLAFFTLHFYPIAVIKKVSAWLAAKNRNFN